MRINFGRGGFGRGFARGGFARGGFGGGGFGRRGSFGGFRGRWGHPGRGFGGSQPQFNPQVQWAQGCLAQLVDPSVPQNGMMGPQTQQALQAFQAQQQLPPTGMLDPNTVNALQGACSGPAGPPMGEVATGEQGEFPFDLRFHHGDRFREQRHDWRWDKDRRHRDRDRHWPFLLEAEAGDTGEGEYRHDRQFWDHRQFSRLPEHRRISWAQSCLAQILGPWVVQDGVYGPNTAAAIRAFQEHRGLAVNGALDDATVHTLHHACGG